MGLANNERLLVKIAMREREVAAEWKLLTHNAIMFSLAIESTRENENMGEYPGQFDEWVYKYYKEAIKNIEAILKSRHGEKLTLVMAGTNKDTLAPKEWIDEQESNGALIRVGSGPVLNWNALETDTTSPKTVRQLEHIAATLRTIDQQIRASSRRMPQAWDKFLYSSEEKENDIKRTKRDRKKNR